MSKNRKAGAGLAAASGYPFRAKKRKDKYSRAVIYAVHGFWSGDNVRVSQSRDHRDEQWEAPQINWSCGGREPKQEPDDIVAVGCFAKAMADAVKVARKWQKDNGTRSAMSDEQPALPRCKHDYGPPSMCPLCKG